MKHKMLNNLLTTKPFSFCKSYTCMKKNSSIKIKENTFFCLRVNNLYTEDFFIECEVMNT